MVKVTMRDISGPRREIVEAEISGTFWLLPRFSSDPWISSEGGADPRKISLKFPYNTISTESKGEVVFAGCTPERGREPSGRSNLSVSAPSQGRKSVGSWMLLQTAILHIIFVNLIKGSVTYRNGPSSSEEWVYACLPIDAFKCGTGHGTQPGYYILKLDTLKTLFCTLCASWERKKLRREFHSEDAECDPEHRLLTCPKLWSHWQSMVSDFIWKLLHWTKIFS